VTLDTIGPWLLSKLRQLSVQVLRDGLEQSTTEAERLLLEQALGEREAKEVPARLDSPAIEGNRRATILLPGFLGSLLASTRGISTMLWFKPDLFLNGYINLLEIDYEGEKDRSPDVNIVPVGIEKLTYLKLISSLIRRTRLYEFPYDWRRRLEHNSDILHTSIQRWKVANSQRQFVLVGHSMGGMLARTYLARYPKEAEQCIERVIMLGSPLYGSPVAALAFYDEALPSRIGSLLHPGNDIPRLIKSWPAIYQLLPPPPDLWPLGRSYPANWDIYDAEAWGLRGMRQDYLDDARRFHQLIMDSDPQLEIVQIAGCNKRTLTDVWRSFADGGDPLAKPNYTLVHEATGDESGDGTVPMWSVEGEGISTYYVEELHGSLPSNDVVIDAILDLIHGDEPGLAQQVPEPTGMAEKLASVPLAQQAADLRRRLEEGRFSKEDLLKFFFTR